jgi:hypothetical protein
VDLIKDYFLEANPNPERIGCPDESTIRALAEDRLPVSHPGRLHMAECSECFAEYRGYRRECIDARRARRKVLAWAIAASLILFAAGGGLWEYLHLRAENSSGIEMALSVPVDAQVDLFNAGTYRGENDGANQLQAVTLPAAVVNLAVTLPRFSDPGPYEVLVSKDKTVNRVVAKAAGQAQEMNDRELLNVTLDLRAARKGEYFLATVRGEDRGTYYYSVTVK